MEGAQQEPAAGCGRLHERHRVCAARAADFEGIGEEEPNWRRAAASQAPSVANGGRRQSGAGAAPARGHYVNARFEELGPVQADARYGAPEAWWHAGTAADGGIWNQSNSAER